MPWLFKDPVVIMKEIKPWLFKDPINSGLARFDHGQWNWKNGLKDIAPIFHSKRFLKNSQSWLWVIRMCHFRAQNGPFFLNKIFFSTNHCYYFHLPIGLFHCAKFKKILKVDAEMHHFWVQNGLHAPICFWKINIFLIHLLAPFTAENFQKFFLRIQSYEDAQFLGPKWPVSPNENFFRKSVNESCFFHSYLSTCQKSKPDINILVKHWWLKNTEISLPESNFWL